jgi:hypothetical protein
MYFSEDKDSIVFHLGANEEGEGNLHIYVPLPSSPKALLIEHLNRMLGETYAKGWTAGHSDGHANGVVESIAKLMEVGL